MQFFVGIVILFVLAVAGCIILVGYPTLVKAVCLSLYRHARRVEEEHRRYAAQVSEEWIRELEK